MIGTLEFIASIIIAVITSVAGTHIYEKWKENKRNMPLRRILNFGEDDLVFVFSHRDHIPDYVLPRTATEDFLAINNVISALLKIGWKRKVYFKDTARLNDNDKKRNLVSICSSKSNPFTDNLLKQVAEKDGGFKFEKLDGKDQWQIADNHAFYPSKSYKQIAEYLNQNKVISEQEIDDVAILAKISNPLQPSNKIIIVAGIRGIGTWGAAECIKKNWQQIYKKKSDEDGYKKDGDFAAVIAVH